MLYKINSRYRLWTDGNVQYVIDIESNSLGNIIGVWSSLLKHRGYVMTPNFKYISNTPQKKQQSLTTLASIAVIATILLRYIPNPVIFNNELRRILSLAIIGVIIIAIRICVHYLDEKKWKSLQTNIDIESEFKITHTNISIYKRYFAALAGTFSIYGSCVIIIFSFYTSGMLIPFILSILTLIMVVFGSRIFTLPPTDHNIDRKIILEKI